MLYTTENPHIKTIRVNGFSSILRNSLIEVQKREIRQNFDSLLSDYQKEGCINVALEMGFTELATEMKSDLQHELQTA